MQEKIGNIILDDTYYGGEDLYSEGAIEEELLETAKNCRDRELAEVVAAKKSWPVSFFSHPSEHCKLDSLSGNRQCPGDRSWLRSYHRSPGTEVRPCDLCGTVKKTEPDQCLAEPGL